MQDTGFFQRLYQAAFINRPNRFVVECMLDGKLIPAYLPNPGRLRELLLPGRKIYLAKNTSSSGGGTEFTAVAVERDGNPVMLHTHLNNEVARLLIEQGRVPGLEGVSSIKREFTVGRSRFDFLLNQDGRDIVLEVKSCTLFGRHIAMFPDAVTARGRKHLLELASLSRKGMRAGVLFIVHWQGVRFFLPDYHTDLEFSRALLSVKDRIMVKALAVEWRKDLTLGDEVRELAVPWDLIQREAHDSGSYIVILRMKRDRRLSIGCLGNIRFKKGYYLYVGSAKANLTKRIERHRSLRKKLFWHIDYLRQYADFHAALPVRASAPLECDMAEAVSRVTSWEIPGFGSSDCSCKSHLFGMAEDPLRSQAFIDMLQYFRIDRLDKELLP